MSGAKKQQSPAPSMHESLGFLLNRAGRAMRKRLQENFDQAGFTVPIDHWVIIAHLWERDGQQQQELANCIFKDKGTVARAINSLEELGFVERKASADDRRYNLIFLTEKGLKLRCKLGPILSSTIQTVSKGIDGEDMEICKKVLRQIYHNVDTEQI